MKLNTRLNFSISMSLTIGAIALTSSYIMNSLKDSPGWPLDHSVWITILYIAFLCFFVGVIILFRQIRNKWDAVETKKKFTAGGALMLLGITWIFYSIEILSNR